MVIDCIVDLPVHTDDRTIQQPLKVDFFPLGANFSRAKQNIFPWHEKHKIDTEKVEVAMAVADKSWIITF